MQSQQDSQKPVEYTVWTLRITTSDARGAGMLEDRAGVQLALVARDGRTILRRLSPLYDSEAADSDLFEICRVRILPCRCLPKSFIRMPSTDVCVVLLAAGTQDFWAVSAQPSPLLWHPLPSRWHCQGHMSLIASKAC